MNHDVPLNLSEASAQPVNEAEQALGRPPQEDDFLVETHPSTNKPVAFTSYEGYTDSLPTPDPSIHQERRRLPWAPFQNRLDFELAAFMRQTGLDAHQMDKLLSLVSRISETPDKFSLVDSQQVKELWQLSANDHHSRVRPILDISLLCNLR
jgi:hypothetical protein